MDNDAPAAIFKRSKARTTRTRAVSPSDDAQKEGEDSAAPSTLAAKLKKQHRERTKPKARLSFGGDEEEGDGEVFQVKKSGVGRKLKLASIALPSGLDQVTATPQTSGGVYSKEYLTELRASTQAAPSAVHTLDPTPDSDIVLDASEMAGAVIVDETVATGAEIPSESSIAAAKQRREVLRKTKQTEEDFISLSVTRKEDIYQGPHPESRLMREDDDLGEGDDEFAEYTAAQERIALGKKAKKKDAERRRATMQEMIAEAEEEDEETIEWEREQLRRGARRDTESANTPKPKQEYRPAQVPPPTPLPSLETAIARLSLSLTQLTDSHASSTTSVSNLTDEREILEGKEKEMRTMVEEAESKRSWFSSFREWVETVATFLDEKYPQLERLEEEYISLLKERSDMTSKRRGQDDEDDLSLFLASPSSDLNNGHDALDELGRVIPGTNSTIALRERRIARAARHSRHTDSQEEEGYSTDSSLSPSDEADFQAAMSSLQDKVRSILQDVRSDEFREPEKGVGRWFGMWRDKYSDTYSGAFGGLGMVSAWEFWVRLEMLGWDPISNQRALDSFAWFGALYDYSRSAQLNDTIDEDRETEPQLGPDGDLASAMLSTIVPRLCKTVQGGAFDPYSSKHVRAIIDLAEQVEASAAHEKFELLEKTVFTIFRQAVDNDIAVSQPYIERGGSAKFDPEAIPARRRFLSRRYKLLANLMRWRRYTGEKFGVGEAVSRLVRDCIHPIAVTGWEVGGEEFIRKVCLHSFFVVPC
ncbi:uncharacterized protein FOMMEDRAFT_97947 [Fomitiporia mediterranea MF3/22]|uniref:uncharacterized protein n=1 Tax=Fomitiporia mediterranea (strain MF3/22) TaxID=694068 RepID=UPI00044081A6|nr:uncharacterized protein FOMMEDRAFT_97947 [Fomitiporia mediterranea MF3/22]EJC98047.1 hypothetical protein FOMMEDRAFT_97947 [Fomitiporia mediterranea MF3/22]